MGPKSRRREAQNGTIRFLLNDQARELGAVDPNMTVLNYLRRVERKTGTKEGCAEGDCGACSVVLGQADGNRVRYQAVNACILFVPVLDGKQLITAEGVADDDGTPHPAQRAMSEYHGSQCGFCTPGFVMSLFALHASEPKPSRQRINDVLAGNLCRCTGYRPIVEAAQRMYGYRGGDRFAAAEKDTLKRLKALRRRTTLALEAKGRRYFAPTTLNAMAKLCKAHPDACILAGGTDVGLWVTKEHRDLDTLIYTGNVKELASLKVADGRIDIGAAVTLTDAMDVIARHYPRFGELLRRFASVQIRNSGTIGGNVANGSPIGDSMPALIALGANVVVRHGSKSRQVPLDDFYHGYRETDLRPGEFVERIRVPVKSAARRFGAYKVSKRFDQDISGVLGAYALELDGGRVRDIRICYGGMAAVPKRAVRCEKALIGQNWSDDAVARAMQALDADFQPLSDMRASADYRMLVAKNLLRKFWMETTNPDVGLDVVSYGM
jgi:xanthine dehydrogenase small subunit